MTSGHGHVTPNPDGTKARCGGPALCPICAKELAAYNAGAFQAHLDRCHRCRTRPFDLCKIGAALLHAATGLDSL